MSLISLNQYETLKKLTSQLDNERRDSLLENVEFSENFKKLDKILKKRNSVRLSGKSGDDNLKLNMFKDKSIKDDSSKFIMKNGQFKQIVENLQNALKMEEKQKHELEEDFNRIQIENEFLKENLKNYKEKQIFFEEIKTSLMKEIDENKVQMNLKEQEIETLLKNKEGLDLKMLKMMETEGQSNVNLVEIENRLEEQREKIDFFKNKYETVENFRKTQKKDFNEKLDIIQTKLKQREKFIKDLEKERDLLTTRLTKMQQNLQETEQLKESTMHDYDKKVNKI